MLTDAVEFIDTTQSAVSQDEGTCLKLPLTTILFTAANRRMDGILSIQTAAIVCMK